MRYITRIPYFYNLYDISPIDYSRQPAIRYRVADCFVTISKRVERRQLSHIIQFL
jgi:hypothetical protein